MSTVYSPHLNHHQPRTVIQRKHHQNRYSGICLAKKGVYRPTVYKLQDSHQTKLSVTMELNVDKILCRDISHMKTKERQSYVIPRTIYIQPQLKLKEDHSLTNCPLYIYCIFVWLLYYIPFLICVPDYFAYHFTQVARGNGIDARILHQVLTQYFTPWGINLQMPWVWVNRATTRLAVANGSKDHRSSQR